MRGKQRRMRPAAGYAVAAVAAVTTTGAAARGLLDPDDPSAPALFTGAASAVVLVLAVTAGRLGVRPSLGALAGAPLLGVLLAAAAHLAIVLPLSVVYGPAQQLVDLVIGVPGFDELDDRLMVLLLLTAGALAPVTEEPAKAVAAGFARAETRREAFLAGATAGAGFSIVEHAFYAVPAAEYGDVWVEVLLLRSVSAAMHPLATGLVFLGWWEYRRTAARTALVRGLVFGIGLHAVWNVTALVMEGVAVGVSEGEMPRAFETLGLTYAGFVGVAIAFLLWRTVTAVTEEEPVEVVAAEPPPSTLRPRPALGWSSDPRAWVALGAALAFPLSLLTVVLPRLR